jgi:hypothetical protein
MGAVDNVAIDNNNVLYIIKELEEMFLKVFATKK